MMPYAGDDEPPFGQPGLGPSWVRTALTLHGGMYLIYHHLDDYGGDNLLAVAAGVGTGALMFWGSMFLANFAGRLTLAKLKIPASVRQLRMRQVPILDPRTLAERWSALVSVLPTNPTVLVIWGVLVLGLVLNLVTTIVTIEERMSMTAAIGIGTAGLLCWTVGCTMYFHYVRLDEELERRRRARTEKGEREDDRD